MEAALKKFAEQGYNSTSISQIAETAGISKGLIYNYFKNKEEILRSIFMDIFSGIFSRYNLPENGVITREIFIEFINTNIDIILEDQDRAVLYFSLFTQPHVMAKFKNELTHFIQPLVGMFLNYYKAQGHENPMAMMRLVSACIDGVQMHMVLDRENFPVEDVRKLLIETFVK